MARIVTIVTEDFADWETALLNAVARGYYGAGTAYAAPGGRAVTSMGGMRIDPDLALEDIDVDALDALVVCGGSAWRRPQPPEIGPAARAAHAAGRIVAGICDGTFALARAGLLDAVPHTSNGAGYLDASGYAGAAHYRDVPGAVCADRIVTAPATAPVRFAESVLGALGLGDDRLRDYVGLHARQYGAEAAITV